MPDQQIQLTVKVNAETGQLEVLGNSFKNVSGKADQAGGSLGKLSGEAGGLLKSFLPFATGAGILAFFTSAVKGAEEQNEALRRLAATVKGTGKSWEESRVQVELWTNAVANSTRFSDGQAISTLEKFTRVTGNVKQAQSASVLAMNLAVASGKDLSETTSLVTDLLNGNERALIGVKREFGNVAGGAKTTQEALDLLSNGTKNAAIESKGLTDSTAKLENSFSQFKDAIGNSFTPALTGILDITTSIVNKFEKFSLIVANIAAKGFVDLGSGSSKIRAQMKAIDDETERQFSELDAKKTAKLQSGENERLIITKAAKDKNKAEDDQAEAELNQKQAERQQQVLQLEASLNQKIASLSQSTLQQKLNALNAEVAAEKQKNDKIGRSNIEREKLNDKLNQYHLKKSQEISNADLQIKISTALLIADTALQTFAILNAMGNKHNEAEANRAKAILALEKAIAIARVWSAPSTGPWDVGLKIAQTGLIVAQFAQQNQAINQSQAQFRQNQSQISFSSDIPGSGIPTGITVGNGGGFSGGGNSGSGNGSGGGLQFVITFQGDIVIEGVEGADKISDRFVDTIGEKIIEKIRGLGQISFTGGQ